METRPYVSWELMNDFLIEAFKGYGVPEEDAKIVAGVDLYGDNINYPVYRSFADLDVKADVIIDFSNPSVLDTMLSYAVSTKTPMIICTTGFSDSQANIMFFRGNINRKGDSFWNHLSLFYVCFY